MRVVIIGAGVGGLACGIRLASKGFEVTILEKNDVPGGRCHRVAEGGFSFDTGPTLLMMPDALRRLFQDVGRRMEDYISLRRVDPAYRVTFSDGRALDFTQKMSDMEREVRRVSPTETGALYKYLGEAQDLYRVSRRWFIDRALEKPSDYASFRTVDYLLKNKTWRSVYKSASDYFKSPHLRMAFSFQTLYLGISPLDCPSIYGILPYIDLVEGVHYPDGGMGKISEVLARLFLELGGRLRTAAEVEEIIVDDGRASGVLLHDETVLPADIVVSNADLPATYRRLLKRMPPSLHRRRVLNMKKSCSAAVFLWGVDQSYPHLLHHNIYLPMNYEETLHEIFAEDKIPEVPAFYLCAPSKTDPSTAPFGGESLMALVPVPNQKNPKDWEKLMPVLRQKIMSLLHRTYLPGFAKRIVVEKTLPPTWYENRYALEDASTFGFSPTFFQSAMFRPQRRSPEVKGLYFAGAAAHPGNGVPIVLLSARIAAEAVLEDVGLPDRASDPVSQNA